MLDNIWIIWTIIAAVFAIAEMFTAGFFLLWFGVGAGIAAILAGLGMGSGWQLGAFIIVSSVLVLFSRRFADRFTRKGPSGVGSDRLIGKIGMVFEEIDNIKNTGMVRFGGEEWRAKNEDNEIIEKGERVEVNKIVGTHLIVKAIKEGEQC
ncbi:NfeD family protein [bacterium]|nr:NfeD family protein [bacterium]